MCLRWCSEGGSSGSMQCVWKEGGCESTAQHVATGYMGDVQECEEVWQEWHRALCAKCVELEEEKQLISFTSKM